MRSLAATLLSISIGCVQSSSVQCVTSGTLVVSAVVLYATQAAGVACPPTIIR
ncbi:MAG: hypothetical protein H0T79_08655 [Deltaproteobacteria bacterium]|nr:hypothetical protein [Deltaproteobacteria bacterium]